MRLLLTLVAIFANVWATRFNVDCSRPGACFGEPSNCNPHTDCRSLIKVDNRGNVDLYLRNFVDSHSYAAFPIGQRNDSSVDVMICVPSAQRRMRAIARIGEKITVFNKDVDGFVVDLGDNNYICSFPASEFDSRFTRSSDVRVIIGKFVDNLTLSNAHQLNTLDPLIGDESDELLSSLPVAGVLSEENQPKLNKNIFDEGDSKSSSDSVNFLNRIKSNSDDDDLETFVDRRLANKNLRELKEMEEKKERRRQEDDEDFGEKKKEDVRMTRGRNMKKEFMEEDIEEEEEEKEVPRRRRIQKTKKRPVEEDEEEQEEEEDRFTPRRRSKKPTRRSSDDYEEDDEGRGRRNIRRGGRRRQEEEEDDDYEEYEPKKKNKRNNRRMKDVEDEEDEEFDDEDDEDNGSTINQHFIPIIISILVFYNLVF